MEREAHCPECGDILSVSVEKDRKTREIKIRFFCEGAGDDVFEFEILTGLKDKDLDNLKTPRERIMKEMYIRLLRREPEPQP
ncbi:MAG: hypothetical protein H3Z54_03240 [archaeon]|nr:hypothetical protein [archaeon]